MMSKASLSSKVFLFFMYCVFKKKFWSVSDVRSWIRSIEQMPTSEGHALAHEYAVKFFETVRTGTPRLSLSIIIFQTFGAELCVFFILSV